MRLHKRLTPALAPAAAMALALLLPCAAFAGEGGGLGGAAAAQPGEPAASADRETLVPEPRVPGLEMLPEGVEPPPWKAFGREQKINRLTRISIDVAARGSGAIMNQAGSGKNPPSFSDLLQFGPGFAIEAGFALAPALSIGLSMHVFMMMGNGWELDSLSGLNPVLRLHDNTVFGATIDVRLKLPLSGSSRMLRFSRAEAPKGFSLLGRVGLGPVFMSSWNADWWPDSEMDSSTYEEIEYWGSSVNLMAICSVGIEYRFVNFGLKFEIGTLSLGTPSPSTDPTWTESSKAGNLVMAHFQLGLGVHF